MTINAICLRAKPHGIDREVEFINEGYVSIGWPNLPEIKAGTTAEDLLAQDSSLSKYDITSILTFRNAEIGCKIIVPGINNKNIVNIFEVVENGYEYRQDKLSNFNPHNLKVKHLCEAKKSSLPDPLPNAIVASRRVISNFSKYRAKIDLYLLNNGEDFDDDLFEKSITIIKEALYSGNDSIKLEAAKFVVQNIDHF